MMPDEPKLNQQPIPEAALRDPAAVEMLRIWIAEKKLHCSLRIGVYRETMNIPEEEAWGVILADVARHVANALQLEYSSQPDQSLMDIRSSFDRELAAPTSALEGGMARKH